MFKKHIDKIGRVTLFFANRKLFTCKSLCYFREKRKFGKIYAERFDENFTPDKIKYIIEYRFCKRIGYDLDMDNPKSFNEKIKWLKFNYHNPLVTKCADKYRAREYIADKIGPEYLVDLHGVYDNADEIDFEKLPDQFVLKVNWGCKQNIICRSKKNLDIKYVREKLRKWMMPSENHYFWEFEWGYKDIKPKIICEKYMPEISDGTAEFEFFCFNGEPKWIMVRGFDKRGRPIADDFDINFKRLPFTRKRTHAKGCSAGPVSKPRELKKMLELCRVLSAPFPLVRINIYRLKHGLKIGELTFTPGDGKDKFKPQEWDFKIGEWLKLPEKRVAE